MLRQRVISNLTTSLFLILPQFALAKAPNVLSVADCSGKARFTQQLDEGQSVSVQLEVEKGGEETQLIGEGAKNPVFASSNVNNTLVFDGINGGSWKVCGQGKSQIAFSKVSVLSSKTQTSSALKTGGIIGASVATVGAAAIGLSNGSSSGSGDSAGRGAASSFDVTPEDSSPNSRPVTDDRNVFDPAGDGQGFNDENFSFGDEADAVSPFQ